MIRTGDGARPQLVHHQDKIEKPSRLIRFATRLGLTKEHKPLMDAVEKAYAFVSGNYRQGDQVTLLVDSFYARQLGAAAMLAKHLHDGTRPGDLSRVQSGNVGDVPPGRIPIHCAVVSGLGEKSSVCERNDELITRFPAGIEQIICYDYGNGFQSCATKFDASGSMISREICISRDDRDYELWRHCTKHVIYYYKDRIPQWDNHEPVWTHRLNSPPSEVQGGLTLEATKPFG
ncbi:unnamed protein product, partial [Rhizoctonia solani]